jgi:hypothetical protein
MILQVCACSRRLLQVHQHLLLRNRSSIALIPALRRLSASAATRRALACATVYACTCMSMRACVGVRTCASQWLRMHAYAKGCVRGVRVVGARSVASLTAILRICLQECSAHLLGWERALLECKSCLTDFALIG